MSATRKPPRIRKKSKWPILVLLVFVVLGAVAFFALQSREPSYRGKSLSEWASEVEYGDVDSRAEARTALRAMGEPAISRLIAMLKRRDSDLKRKMIEYAGKAPESLDRWIYGLGFFTPDYLYHGVAAHALGEIGPAASAAVPALEALSNSFFFPGKIEAAMMKIRQEPLGPLLQALEDASSTNWWNAVQIAQHLGTNGQPAVPLLVKALQITNSTVRMQAAMALGGIASSPEITVPSLIEAAKDSDSNVRFTALFGLRNFKREKKQIIPIALVSMRDTNDMVWYGAAMLLGDFLDETEQKNQLVPLLLESLKSSDPGIREQAAGWLQIFDPAAAKKAGVK